MTPNGLTPLATGPQSRLPLEGFTIADTSRAEEAEHILSLELSRLRIQSTADRNHFRLRMNGVRLGDVLVGFNRFDVHTRVDPGRLDNAFIFSFGHEAPSLLGVDGRSVVTAPTSAAMLSPSCRLRIERPAGSGMFLMRTSPEALEERLESLTGKRLREPLQFARDVDLSTEPGATVLRIVQFVISEIEARGPSPPATAQRSALQNLLFGALLMLPNNYSDLLTRHYRGQISPRLVQVAEEFMAAKAGSRTSITDLLAICGCSRSVLFEAFSRYRNHTPMQFLTDRRMEKARRLLLSGSSQTVTSVAQDCGFTHLGRFAGAYRARFGESPSETLKKIDRPDPEPAS